MQAHGKAVELVALTCAQIEQAVREVLHVEVRCVHSGSSLAVRPIKASADWLASEHSGAIVTKPLGWSGDFRYGFFIESITLEEFERRLALSKYTQSKVRVRYAVQVPFLQV